MNRVPELVTRADEQPDALTVRSFVMRADTANDGARTIDATLATETPTYVLDRRSYTMIREILVIDRSQRWPTQVPLLDTHDSSTVRAQLGSTRNLRVQNNELLGTRHFSSVEPAVEAFTKVKEGHLTGGSIGYVPRGYTDLSPGESYQVFGRTITNDGRDTLRVTFDFVVIEDSVAAIGRDDKAKVRALSTPSPTPKEPIMTIDELVALYGAQHRALITKLHGEGKAPALIGQQILIAERAVYASNQPTPAASVPANGGATPTAPPAFQPGDETIQARGIQLERSRVAAIRSAAHDDVPATMVTRAIDEGWNVDRFNTEALAHVRANRGQPVRADGGQGSTIAEPMTIIASSEDKCMRAIEAALVTRAFQDQPARMPTMTTEQQGYARELRSVALQGIARLACRAHRLEVPEDPDALFRRALSTVSFPVALGNTLNRNLETAYQTTPSTILQWAKIGSVKDFREHKSIKLGKFARPVKLGKGGQIEHGTIGEEAEGYSADTYGLAIAISRNDFINDDIGIITQLPIEMGDNMRMNLDDVGYEVLTSAAGVGPTMASDSKALFATDHADGANYIAGATVLSSAGLTALKLLLRKIKQSGRTLNLVPKFLIVPPELEHTALELVQSSNITIGGTAAERGDKNVHQGTLVVIVEPRLSGATNGTTAWYLVCEQSRGRSLQVSFLNGNQSPTLERKDPPNVLGLGWITYHDAGVDAIDWRGIARSRGA